MIPNLTDLPGRILIIGGVRSGKSKLAEQLAHQAEAVDYLATSRPYPDDPEWQERIALHAQRRPEHWNVEESDDVAAALGIQSPAFLLVDCITAWLTRAMDDVGAWEENPSAEEALRAKVAALSEAWAASERNVVAVTNEVGQGVVPATFAGRKFRDEMGLVNSALAARADHVFFCIAGIPWKIK